MHELSVLLQIAKRNLFASFLNVVIGGIVLCGTFFFVIGSTILSSVDESMSRSIIGSVSGHIQLFSSHSKDELALFGNWSAPDLTPMPDFSLVEKQVKELPNVKAVVPMGINFAFLAYGNTADQVLEKLRSKVNLLRSGHSEPRILEEIASAKDHARNLVGTIQKSYENFRVLAADGGLDPQDIANLRKACSEEFWKTFDADPYDHLEFLENNISSLIPDADMIPLSYVGTDLDEFATSFDRMELVEGTMVPKGQRGMLLSRWSYENLFKLKTALRLDKIREAITESGRKIATDPDLIQLVKQNRSQIREILLQLDSLGIKRAVSELQAFLSSKETDVAKLMEEFFATDDGNFRDRYDFFYAKIAPMVQLYRLKIGDMLTIKAYTKTGFVEASSVRVYGTFQFKGLEKSSLAGSISLMDLMTFRDLYGYLSPDKIAEMQEIKKAAGAKVVDRENAEAELFGGHSIVTESQQGQIKDEEQIGKGREKDLMKKLAERVYTPEEIRGGIALNAAVILKDPSRLKADVKAIQEKVNAASLDIKVATWQQAAGTIGKLVFFAKMVLYFAVFIIFVVALVIINNAVMMATIQRIREIGTMRAIGAQRSFVLSMVLLETVLLGIVFGLIGTVLAVLLLSWLHTNGIPANNEYLYFFFSGPRLYPELGFASVMAAVIIVLVVTILSALYPAIVATRVSPVQAMASED